MQNCDNALQSINQGRTIDSKVIPNLSSSDLSQRQNVETTQLQQANLCAEGGELGSP